MKNETLWRPLYPFASRWLDRGELRLHYVDEGSGAPIICVHGNPTWSFYFRKVLRAFSPARRVIALDHIGCGLSDKPGDDQYEYTLERRIDDLEALIAHLNLNAVDLLVHDWGGMIGMGWAARHPDQVRSFTAMNTAAFPMPPGKNLPLRLRFCRSAWPLNALAVRGMNAFAGLAASMATKKGLAPDVKAGLLAPYDSWANRIATLRFVQDIPLGPGNRAWDAVLATDKGLAALRGKPAMFLWGKLDFVFDLDYLKAWQERFPDATSHVFEDSGHYVLEDAFERILPLLREFWS